MMLPLKDDSYCFACGKRNPVGLGLKFEWDGERILCAFTPRKEHQGYVDIIHGGIITTILDECMAHSAIRTFGVMAATAEITVRLKAPLGPDDEVRIEARALRPSTRLITATAEMRRLADGALIATATAKLMPENTQSKI